MNRIAIFEYSVLSSLLIVFASFLIPSLYEARRDARDTERIENLASIKRSLEMKNNELGYYPKDFDAEPYQFIVVQDEGQQALSWYLRAKLERDVQPRNGVDQEPGRNYFYRIVRDGNTIFYDICGGILRCDVE